MILFRETRLTQAIETGKIYMDKTYWQAFIVDIILCFLSFSLALTHAHIHTITHTHTHTHTHKNTHTSASKPSSTEWRALSKPGLWKCEGHIAKGHTHRHTRAHMHRHGHAHYHTKTLSRHSKKTKSTFSQIVVHYHGNTFQQLVCMPALCWSSPYII